MFDVRQAEAARKAWEGLDAAWQQVDVLINNAGLALGLEKTLKQYHKLSDGIAYTELVKLKQ